MMRILLFLLFLCLGGVANAQLDYDQRLLAKFTPERLTKMKSEHPEILAYWTYYLDESYVIVDSEVSGKAMASESEVQILDLANFNILDLGLTMDRNQRQTFAIQGTNKYLVLMSNNRFVDKFNRSQTNK
jgi:hypothetical protein